MKPREGALKQGWFLSRVTFPEAKKLPGRNAYTPAPRKDLSWGLLSSRFVVYNEVHFSMTGDSIRHASKEP